MRILNMVELIDIERNIKNELRHETRPRARKALWKKMRNLEAIKPVKNFIKVDV